MNTPSKEKKFTSSIGFVAASTAAAVGLGNIWKFPYEVGAHGGAYYLLIYTFFVIVLGFPLVLAKSAFGRKVGKGVYGCYQSKGKWNIMGLLASAVCVLAFSFYTVVLGWIVGYAIEMVKGKLLLTSNMKLFFTNYISHAPTNMLYHTLVIIAVLVIVIYGIQKGIEKSSMVLMPIFMLMLLGLIVYALCLQGAGKGIAFYLYPNHNQIQLSSFSSALSHAFLSLTLGTGVMVTYGSYAQKSDDLVYNSSLIVGTDFLVAFLAGLLIFPLVFHQNIAPSEGPGLIFITLPGILQKLGMVKGTVLGITFFALLLLAGITSAISQLAIPTQYMMERFKLSRTHSAIVIAVISYIIGIPSLLSHGGSSFFSQFITFRGTTYSFMDCIINMTTDLLMPIACILFCFFITRYWKAYSMDDAMKGQYNYSRFFLRYIYFSVKYVSPILITIIMLVGIFS